VGTVQDLVISEFCGKKFVFALHLDGALRIWDLASHSKVFSHNMGVMAMSGTVYVSFNSNYSFIFKFVRIMNCRYFL